MLELTYEKWFPQNHEISLRDLFTLNLLYSTCPVRLFLENLVILSFSFLFLTLFYFPLSYSLLLFIFLLFFTFYFFFFSYFHLYVYFNLLVFKNTELNATPLGGRLQHVQHRCSRTCAATVEY